MKRCVSSIAAAWEGFREQCIPDGAPAEQFREMRRAFYAGVSLTLGTLNHATELDDDRAMATILAMHDECMAFAEHVRDGFDEFDPGIN
jgi:hypothetical protein